MSTALRTTWRRVPLAAVAAVVVALALSALTADARNRPVPPRIGPMPVALFNKETSDLGFSARVIHANRVVIHHGSRRRRAERVRGAGTETTVEPFRWQATFSDGNRRRCYRITVVARRANGAVSRKVKACRLGTRTRGSSQSNGH